MILYLSIALYILGFGLSGYLIRSNRSLITLSASVFFFFLLTTLFFVADDFTGQGINEAVIYHALYGFKGAGVKEYLFIAILGVGFLLLTIAASILCYLFHKRLFTYQKNKVIYGLSIVIIITAFLIHPATLDFAKLGYSRYLSAREAKENMVTFQKEYAKDQIQTKEDPLNLVFIYGESLEQTYFDENLFPGLVPDLKRLEKSYEFTNIEPLWATGFTIAGMLGSQCGIPLVLGYNDMAAATDSFYEGAHCLGDILKSSGYHLTFLQGTSIVFSGIKNIYASHQFDEVMGRQHLIPKLKRQDYLTNWGLYDDSLLPLALEIFQKNAKNHKRHATFVATMDTHHPDGHLSESCLDDLYGDGQNPVLNAVHCSQKLIANFVGQVSDSEYGKNTIIVVVSDHLAMRNTATSILKTGNRRNLFFVVDPRKNKKTTISRRGSIFDTAATALDLMGFTGSLGLGRSLLNKNQKTILEKYFNPNQKLQSWRNEISRLWKMPSLSKDTGLIISDGLLKVKDKTYKYPLFVYANNDNSLSPHFGKNVLKKLKKNARLRPYLWIDRCKTIAKYFKSTKIKSKYCYATSRKHIFPIEAPVTIKGSTLLPKIKSLLSNNPKIPPSAKSAPQNASDRSRYIAHAGGKYKQYTYTNSLEALDTSYKKGFRLFELDISKTSDGVFVAAHGWKSWKNKTKFPKRKDKKHKPSLAEFKAHKRINGTTSIDMDDINQWFQSHSDATLVTDKINRPKTFIQQYKFSDRLIMELFSEEAVQEALQAKVTPMPSWLHVIKPLKQDKLQYFLRNKIEHMSMPIGEISGHEDILKTFRDNGIKIYLYHINYIEAEDEAFVTCRLMNLAHGMYADSWSFPKTLQCNTL